jgi:hypothetical protein
VREERIVMTQTTGSKPAKSTKPTSSKPSSRSATSVVAPATVRTMIVVQPEYLASQTLNSAGLAQQFGGRATVQPRFMARQSLKIWQRSQLVGLRKGSPAWCAGGPARLLDLDGLRYAAGIWASVRHELFSSVVNGTRPARPWHVVLGEHLADPDCYSRQEAWDDFLSQPRVNAMRLHNSFNPGVGVLDLLEVEVYQAGSVAYRHYSAATAVCGDALLYDDGTRLAPASDALLHRTTYLEQSLRMVDTLPDGQRLVAVTL